MTSVLNDIKVPFHRASLGEEEIQAVGEVLRSGWLTMGAKTFEFERQFAEYIGVKYAIAVCSCTAALHLSLEAVGVQAGDEVLIPTTTFTATAEVVTYLGARPVFVDIDPLTMNLAPNDAERQITPRTRAIIPVHFAGQPCDMSRIRDLAESHKLHIVEDAAHALPSSYKNRRIGTLSDLTAFSFYATKTLTTGEGGMITTNNDAYAKRMQMMRLHGISRDAWNRYGTGGSWRYEVQEAGYKYNLTDLQSAIGIVQLAKCDEMNGGRQRIAERYNNAFIELNALEVPRVLSDRKSSWHLYVLRLHLDRLSISRDHFIDELNQRGITASVHFIPLHLQPYYQKHFGYKAGDYPQAEHEYNRCLSLPIYPDMSNEEADYVIHAVSDIVQRWTK
jgi:dTDP-4-amino-4,6-dideoxygalactose transaminase